MDNKNNIVSEKIIKFFQTSFNYYGKEIALQSKQHFSIYQVVDEEKELVEEYDYHIQYGFPQSGCVSMRVHYSGETESFSISGITVYAPPVNKEMVIANFEPQIELGEVNISINYGMDMETEKHTSINSIAANQNAIKLLEIAVKDLSQAEVLGECTAAAPIGSNLIPCSNSVNRQRGQKSK